MGQWVAIGVFLLGAGSGALLTWIARTGLRARRDSAGDKRQRRKKLALKQG